MPDPLTRFVTLRNGRSANLTFSVAEERFYAREFPNVYWTVGGTAYLTRSNVLLPTHDVAEAQETTDFPAAPLTAKHPFEAPPPPPAQRARVDDAEAEAMGRVFQLAASLLACIQKHKSEGSPVVSMAVLDITRALAMLVVWGYEAPQEWLKIRDAADLALYDVEHRGDKQA